jgi:non-specific serine/threonine protein kinase/serine/threonine-protein kinase
MIGAPADSVPFQQFGPYRLKKVLGEGGMGVVWLAEREDAGNLVAIKFLPHAGLSPARRERFAREIKTLAKLKHPLIARLYDAGTLADGTPWFVMEYVEGIRFTDYCRREERPVEERLRLFRSVCEAVQYAHGQEVIHRDLKPSNILVEQDGTPRLLDFGIARQLQEPDGLAEQTRPDLRFLSPDYAAPEWARDGIVGFYTDVYSLGVIFYELLTGRLPFDRQQQEDVRHAADPEKPSVAVCRFSRGAGAGARTWAPSKSAWNDLDVLCLKALHKDVAARYPSVEALTRDVDHYLSGQPLDAVPGSLQYHLSKYVKRHRLGLAAASLIVLSLISGLAVALREAHVARVQRANAERRFNDVRRLANSLIYDIHDSIRDLPGSTRARKLIVQRALEYLDSLAQEAHGDLSLQRELATAYERVGDVQGNPQYANLGDKAGALRSYEKAHAIRKILAAAGSVSDRVTYAASCRSLAQLEYWLSDAAGAVKAARESIAVTKPLLRDNPANRDVLEELARDYISFDSTLVNTGANLANTDFETNYQKAFEIDQKLAAKSGDPHQMRRVESDELFIATHLLDSGFYTLAIAEYQKALAISEGLAADTNNAQAQRDLASAHNYLGAALLMSRADAKALPIFQEALREWQRISIADANDQQAPLSAAEAALNVGVALTVLGNPKEALKYLRRSIDVFEKALASDPKNVGANYDLAGAYVWQGSVLSDLSEPVAALEEYHKALVIQQRLALQDPSNTYWRETSAGTYAKMGDFLRREHKPGSAEENYRRAVSISEALLAADRNKVEPKYVLADTYFGLGELSYARAAQTLYSPQRLAALAEAKSWYERSSDAWRQIPHPAVVSPDGLAWGDSKQVWQALARCQAALTKLQGTTAANRTR